MSTKINILEHAKNHTKLNFGKIVHSIKENEKNCVVIKNTYLNNKTLKGIGLMQLFSVKRLCLILLNMYSLYLRIVYVPLPLILCFVALVLIFFSEQPFYGNYSTLDSHTNTVISHTFAYSSRWRRKPWQGLSIRFVYLFFYALNQCRKNLHFSFGLSKS